MLLARQSREVTMQDEHQRTSPLIRGVPWLAPVVDEFNVRECFADLPGHL
jgi:hypothetical protein